MTPLVIAGAVGNALDILDAVRAPAGGYRCVGFVDDGPALQGAMVQGLPVLGPLAHLRNLPDVQVVVGIGSARTYRGRAEFIAGLGLPPERFATVIHPLAAVSPAARLGAGAVVLAGASVCAQARLGAHVLVLQNVVVGHDAEIGDATCVAPGAVVSGRVKVGTSSYLGAGAVIHDGIAVGERALVGLGAVVVRDVPDGAHVFGNPARRLRS